MANRFLIISVITFISVLSLTQCVNESVDHPRSTAINSTVNPNFNPNSTIPGNNSFIVDDTVNGGNVYLLDSIFVKKYRAVRGRCDCDTVVQCNYYIISGYFEADSAKLKASFNVYFTKKPTVSMNYAVLPFESDTTNKLKYNLDDNSVFLKVSDISKTRKTWGGVNGVIHVDVINNLPTVSFSSITGKNLSNVSDTTSLSGKFECTQ